MMMKIVTILILTLITEFTLAGKAPQWPSHRSTGCDIEVTISISQAPSITVVVVVVVVAAAAAVAVVVATAVGGSFRTPHLFDELMNTMSCCCWLWK